MEKIKCEILKSKIKVFEKIKSELCVLCKGTKNLCGLGYCPILKKLEAQLKVGLRLPEKEEIYGISPNSVFVGTKGYPKVYAGPSLTILEDDNLIKIVDNPKRWYGLSIEEILKLRYSLIGLGKKLEVRKEDKLKEKIAEVSLAENFVDVEARLRKKLRLSLFLDPLVQPFGPRGIIERLEIVSNPRISKKVEKIVEDELKAREAVYLLYTYAQKDVWEISKIFSSGILGKESNRKIVPTRWSITAIDSMLADELIKNIRSEREIGEYWVFSNEFLGNHFEILLMPKPFSFEMFEAWFPKSLWVKKGKPVIQQEYEFSFGRKTYAEKEAGAYYAARFAVAEFLFRIKRQASAIIIREIYPEYAIPVGVWEVRENVRRALMKNPKKFGSAEEALADKNKSVKIDAREYGKRSVLLNQKNLYLYSK